MFWSLMQPADLYAGESPPAAQVRARLTDAVAGADVASRHECLAMHAVTGTTFGNSPKWHRRLGTRFDGWAVEACGSSVPNTHWHLLRRPTSGGSMWMAWRVHRVSGAGRVGPDGIVRFERGHRWEDMGAPERREHLRNSAATSPVAESLVGLISELTRQADGSFGASPNTYAFAEVHAIELALGVRHPEGVPVRTLSVLGGFTAARALNGTIGGLWPEPSARFPYRSGSKATLDHSLLPAS